jgi:hypothetical protein
MQRYNVSSGTWTSLASVPANWSVGYPPQRLNYHNGKFYLIAQNGSVNSGNYTIISYDVASNTWSTNLALAGNYVTQFSNYNFPSGKINDKIYYFAHANGGVPNLTLNIPKLDAYHLGGLIYFFERACGISGYLMGVNPFDQPGVEDYKRGMFSLLGKPGASHSNENHPEASHIQFG